MEEGLVQVYKEVLRNVNRFCEQIGAGSANDTDLAKITAGMTFTLYIRTDEHGTKSFIRSANTLVCDETIWFTNRYYWDWSTEPTCKVQDATGFVVNRWRAYPVCSDDYSEINITRTGKSFMTLGDSTTAGDYFQSGLVDSLLNLGNDQWFEFPGSFSQGGWRLIELYTGIDAAIANRFGYPDHILINIGKNDASSLPVEATWKTQMRYVTSALHTAYPNARIYIAKFVRLSANPPSSPSANCVTMQGWIADLIAEQPYLYAGADETTMQGADNYTTNFSDVAHYTTAGKAALCALWKACMGY